jgi:hypothetical protein
MDRTRSSLCAILAPTATQPAMMAHATQVAATKT